MEKYNVMSQGNTVRLHRVFATKPEKIFRAFLDADAMAKWLPPYGFTCKVHHFEPKVGGTFKMSFTNFTTNTGHSFGGEYLEIVPNERIIYTYVMHIDGKFLSASVATVTFEKQGNGCKLVLAESGAYAPIFPGDQNKMRKNGTEDLLDALGRFVNA